MRDRPSGVSRLHSRFRGADGFVGEGVEYLLREGIDWVYEKSGLIAGSCSRVPTFHDVKEYVARKPLQGRMSLWKASAMRVLEALCFRHGLGPVVNTDVDWRHDELLNASVVLELDALSDSDKVFFTADSGDRDRSVRRIVITRSGDRDR